MRRDAYRIRGACTTTAYTATDLHAEKCIDSLVRQAASCSVQTVHGTDRVVRLDWEKIFQKCTVH